MIKRCVLAVGLAASTLAQAGNPIVKDIFTADPAALVDNGRVYLYVGKDDAPAGGKDYVMNEWRVYSSCDMQKWTDHGSPLGYGAFKWAKGSAWASDIVKRGGKYYFYATVSHASIPGKAIGVAVSSSPTGPFVDARGSALITNDMTRETEIGWDDIDPAVFVDDDGQAYLYWGNTVLKYAKLKPNMTELDGPIHTVGLEAFTEAAYLHKHKGSYYLSYSRKFPEETVVMRGPTATGPWSFGGVIMEKNSKVNTIHQAIVDFNGKSYIFYHNAKLPGGGEYRRSVAVEELRYGPDGKILPVAQTAEGPAANPSPGCT
ncbi:glycoside hydrolase family 43 protein [Massilia sp. X63]|uniref:glycoside hydrolase family 43 protein n=1 Tax=Massilia sp. X63 TaxID=3237285 RepID=UPI0034DD526C